MIRLAERAVITSTGDEVLVLRRRSLASDAAIVRALEAAGAFVVESPAGIRYRRGNARKFARLAPDAVLLLDKGGDRCAAILPGPYFQAHYRVTGAVRAEA